MTLRARDRRLLRNLVQRIDGIGDPPAPVLPAIMEELRGLLDADFSGAYRPVRRRGGWELDYGLFSDIEFSLRETFARFLAATPTGWGVYDPQHPEPEQRNVVFQPFKLIPRSERTRLPMAVAVLRPHGLVTSDQLRVLVCDGDLLLGWVGAFRRKNFGPRERELLGRLVDPLRRRLLLERQLLRGALMERGLEAALDALSSPAFLLRSDGRAELANAAGRAWLDARGGVMLDGPPGRDVRAAELRVPGLPSYRLVVLARPSPDRETRLAAVARAWDLTPRQVDTLRHVATGDANKTIAEKLRCAEVTVELHLSALLRKAGVSQRAELVARFWTFEP